MYYLDAKFRSVYRLKCDMSVEKFLIMQNVHMAWEVYILSNCGRSSELLTKSGYMRTFIIYIWKGTNLSFFPKNKPNHPMSNLRNSVDRVIADFLFLYYKSMMKKLS
jgi:hypothetical protein